MMPLSNPAAIIKRAQQVISARESARTSPIVVWAAIGESAERFGARVRGLRRNWTGRVLCAVPFGFDVPEGTQSVTFAPKAFAALHPSHHARNIDLFGGRSSTKSWATVRALLLRGLVEPIRVLCLREIQRSLKDSALRLLADQIEVMNLDRYFEVQANSITSHTGALFLFEGMYANVQRIKSLEGIDVCWVEQAEQLSEASWSVLLPTIRKPGSMILMTSNPDLSDDPNYVRFRLNTPPNTISASLNYTDNPWVSIETLAEANYLKRVDLDSYNHVWAGELRQHSDAQVLKGKYEIADFEISSDWAGPFMGLDFGFSVDPTALIKSFLDAATNTLYVTHEAYAIELPLDRLPKLLGTVPGSRDSVIYADNSRPEIINHLRGHDYGNVRSCAKWDGSVQDGILTLRSFAKIVIHTRCEHVAQEAKLYSYKVDRTTGEVLPDPKPGNDHTIDALRYSLQERIRRPPGAGLLAYYAAELKAPPAAPPTSAAPTTNLLHQHDQKGAELSRPAPEPGALWRRALKIGGVVKDI
jgi:phage terminase large subunit